MTDWKQFMEIKMIDFELECLPFFRLMKYTVSNDFIPNIEYEMRVEI